MPLTLYKTFAWQTFDSPRLFTCLVYVSKYYVPIAQLGQNRAFPLLYLGHAQIIRLSRVLSYTNYERKRQIPKLSRANCVTIQPTVKACLITWAGLASSCRSDFYPVLHKKGQPGAAHSRPQCLLHAQKSSGSSLGATIFIWRLEAMRMGSVLPVVLFLAWFIRERDYLENFHPGCRHHNTWIPANRAGAVQCHIIAKLIFVAFKEGAETSVKPEGSSCNLALSSRAFFYSLPLDLTDFSKPPNTHTKSYPGPLNILKYRKELSLIQVLSIQYHQNCPKNNPKQKA